MDVMKRVMQNEDSILMVKELEERLEMTAVATEAENADIEVDFRLGIDKNGPNAKVTLRWLF